MIQFLFRYIGQDTPVLNRIKSGERIGRMMVNLTMVTAIIGAGLGVWNFAQSLWQRRVRLKVVPKLSVRAGRGVLSSSKDSLRGGSPTIEVINLSAFPITIAEVGLSLLGTASRFVIPATDLPKRLEPRESIDISATECVGFPKTARRAYATTQCNHTRYGDSIVLREHRKSQP